MCFEEQDRVGGVGTRSRALAPKVWAVYPPPLQGGAASYLIVSGVVSGVVDWLYSVSTMSEALFGVVGGVYVTRGYVYPPLGEW